MSDEWMQTQRLPLSPEQLRRLPRHPAYHYTHEDGEATLYPRPRFYHTVLELAGWSAQPGDTAEVDLRPVGSEDWQGLERLFASAFAFREPFGTLDEADLLTAARRALTKARSGGDGPWLAEASFIASRPENGDVGALLITLLPDWTSVEEQFYYWDEPPPDDLVRRGGGRPHLTWVFVKPTAAGRGVGTRLLVEAVAVLRRLGYRELLSTFLLGNDSSMLWHWRNGFRLLSWTGSWRRWA